MSSLAPEDVLPLLRGAFGRPYRYATECPSTQDLLLPDDPDGAVAVADHQTAGRGRAGRTWEDAPGDALLCSVLLRQPATAALPQLSLVAALAVAETLEHETALMTFVKWPNDVLAGGRKLAGILLESRGAEGTVVCGIGVNVDQPEERLPATPLLPAGSLRLATGRTHDRAALLASLLERLEARVLQWRAAGLAPLLGDIAARDALRARRVHTDAGAGVADGIAADGRLRVHLDAGGTVEVESGEVVPVDGDETEAVPD